jgi:hypothetical protein
MQIMRLRSIISIKHSPRLLQQEIGLIFLLLMTINGCKQIPKEGFAAFYNFHEHGDVSTCYVEIILPIPFRKTHSEYNDYDYSETRYVKGAELVTVNDTLSIKYSPLGLTNHYFSLTENMDDTSNYTTYVLPLEEPYKWGSLYQADSIVSPLLKGLTEIRYLDASGKYKSMGTVKFKYAYFFDGQPVSKTSNEFYKKMSIERPPVLLRD